jgi:hypothetical protein
LIVLVISSCNLFPFFCALSNIMLNDPFGSDTPTPERHFDFLLAEPINCTRLSLELQATRRRAGQGNLSTFRSSWDMRHDPQPRLEATIHLARPINVTIGAPSSPSGPLALESLPILALLQTVHIPNHNGAPPQPPPRLRRGRGEQRQCAPAVMIVDLSSLILFLIFFCLDDHPPFSD